MRRRIIHGLGAGGAGAKLLAGDRQAGSQGEAAARPVLTPAAVLVPLIERPGGLTILLTRRADNLRAHPGQISFPGGRAEAGDRDAVATALRETEEEIGLSRRHVDVIARMETYETVTGFAVTPVVAFVRPGFELSLDPSEVSGVFEVPLDFVLDPANHRRDTMLWKGRKRSYYAIPFGDHYIWGATAAMLVNFYRKVAD